VLSDSRVVERCETHADEHIVRLFGAGGERQGRLDDDFGNMEPSANWRPGQRLRTRKSVEHTIRHGVRSMLRSVARRDDFDVPDLGHLAAIAGDVDESLAVAVGNLRRQGHSWSVIGEELGVTKQAAYVRFAARVEECSS
jgi:hypothetical protein